MTYFSDDMEKIFTNYTFHRIQLLLKGLVDRGAQESHAPIPRQHYWIFPGRLYHERAQQQYLHKGSLSVRVYRQKTPQTPYEYRQGKVYYYGRDSGLVAFPHAEEKQLCYLREGGGGILCFDMNNLCKFRCAYCARMKRKRATPHWLTLHSEREAIELSLEKLKWRNLEGLQQISVVTGCFGEETALLNHVLKLLEAAYQKGFSGDLYLASHELRSEEAIKTLQAFVKGRFYYAFTVESFTQRKALMPSAKDVDYQSVLQRIRAITGRAYYNYILGLDDYEVFQQRVEQLADIAIPYVSVFSVYTPAQQRLYAPGAAQLDYYFKAYHYLQKKFGKTIYMHDAPFYNVSNRALFPYPIEGLLMR